MSPSKRDVAIILSLLLYTAALSNSSLVLVWADEFDLDHIDLSKWQYEVTALGFYHNEFQFYSQDANNSFVKDGKFFIKPTLLEENINPKTGQPYGPDFMQNGIFDVKNLYGYCTNSGNNGCYRTGALGNIPPVMSARLLSHQKFSFKFGKVEISAKMPGGDWLWPAIWMMPENSVYGGWPRSGEVDIVESIGNRNLKRSLTQNYTIGIQRMTSTLHWGPNSQENKFMSTHLVKYNNANNYGDNFHTYIVDWSSNGISFYIDDPNNAVLNVPSPLINNNPNWVDFYTWGNQTPPAFSSNPWVNGSNMAPFDQPFYFILNVAAGGTDGYFTDTGVNKGGIPEQQKPWSNGDSYVTAMQKFYQARSQWNADWKSEGDNNAMQIDYIRVYQRT